jgi:hypothetical protein
MHRLDPNLTRPHALKEALRRRLSGRVARRGLLSLEGIAQSRPRDRLPSRGEEAEAGSCEHGRYIGRRRGSPCEDPSSVPSCDR